MGRTDKIYGLSLVYAPLSSFSDRIPISNYAIRCRFASKSTHYRLFCLFCSASQYSIACCFSHIFHPTFIDFQTIINYIQTYYYIMKYCLHRDKLMSATANPTILISKILYCHACRTDLERRAGRISAKRGRKSRVRRLRTKQKQGAPTRTHPEKSTYDSDMYNRAFPVGNALFFFAWDMMSLLRLPRGKLPLTFLAVPAGKDGWVECPCQTVDDFIGIRGSVCGLFLFVQTHAPLDIGKQHTMCLLLCCLVFNICECGFQRGKVVLMLVNDLQNHITLHIIGHKL